MTPKSLWIILIRIFGIYFIFQKITTIPQLAITLFSFHSVYQANDPVIFLGVFWSISIEFLFLFIIIYFIIKPTTLIHLLKLDQDFDVDLFEWKISNANIITIAVFIIGGVMLADSLPLFCRNLFMYYQKVSYYNSFKNYPSAGWSIYYGVKLVVGYLMIAYGRKIGTLIDRRSKNAEDVIPDNNAL